MRTDIVGELIENYRILEEIGKGGMGIVYKAMDIDLEMIVAMKMIDPLIAHDERFLKRFRDEAKTLAKLENPNIVAIHRLLPDTEYGVFIVMEYVDGVTLKDWIQDKGAIPYRKALNVTKQLLHSIGYAHQQNVTHRDLKPGNIMLTKHGLVKLMDFGLAKIEHGADSTITHRGVGTLKYMSPEQVAKPETLDHRTDIYSLGMTLYEMLTGKTPFKDSTSEYSTGFSIMKAIVEKSFPTPDYFNSGVPKSLNKIVMRALEKSPDKRFQATQEMLRAIKHFERLEALKLKRIPSRPSVNVKKLFGSVVQKFGTVKIFQTPNVSIKTSAINFLDRYGKYIFLGVLSIIAFVFIFLILQDSSSISKIESVKNSKTNRLSSISIFSEPVKASVFLNGQYIGSTPITDREVDPGKQRVNVQKENYLATDSSVTIVSGQSRDLNITLKPAAIVSIEVSPEDAEVMVNSDLIPQSKMTELQLSTGLHQLKVTRQGYETVQKSLRLKQGRNSMARVVLVPIKPPIKATRLYSKLRITTEPEGASIWIDGIFKETTPVTISNVKLGNHRIELKKPGYQDFAVNYDVIEQPTNYFYRRLTKVQIFILTVVAFDTTDKSILPVHAYIIADNVNKGTTPRQISLPAGRHTIVLRCDGYIPVRKFINLTEDIRIPFILRKSPQ